jgi:soluble lytic murein transglycosylase
VTSGAVLGVATWFAEHYAVGPGSAPYRPIIDRWAREYGVDPDMVAAVLECESSGRPRAVSRSGARGLMQLMPETAAGMAAELGLPDPSPQRVFDPELNIRLGTYYLSKLWARFGGDRVLVIAAYHAGPSRIADSLKRRGNPSGERLLPDIDAPVTRAYVGKVVRRWERLAGAAARD